VLAGRVGAIARRKFSDVRKLFESFCSEIQNLNLKISSILGKFEGKIEILSTRNFLGLKFAAVCWKFACSVCRKIAASCLAYWFDPRLC